MAFGINRVELIGRLGADVSVNHLVSGGRVIKAAAWAYRIEGPRRSSDGRLRSRVLRPSGNPLETADSGHQRPDRAESHPARLRRDDRGRHHHRARQGLVRVHGRQARQRHPRTSSITSPFPYPACAFSAPTVAPSLGRLRQSGSSVPHIHPSLQAPVSMS